MDQPTLPIADAPRVEVRRSARRRRTVSAYRERDTIVVLIPARMSRADEQTWVRTMVERIVAGEAKRRPSDEALLRRAEDLSQRYYDGQARPSSVRWVSNQRQRWGSCTPSDGSIRISLRVQGMPDYVLDYVLLHELTHLLEVDHSPRFHELLSRYPQVERARGFLEGVTHATDPGLSTERPPATTG